jgi:hypothetical protein
LGADNALVIRMLFSAFKCAATVTEKDQHNGLHRPDDGQTAPRIC